MAGQAECATTRAVLGVLGPMAAQVMELKEHHGPPSVPYSAATTSRLIKQCQALGEACDLLCSCLEATAQARQDDQLLAQVREVKAHLKEVTEGLAQCTADLQSQGPGLRDAWQGLLAGAERLLEGVTAALVSWERATVRGVTLAITHLRGCLANLLGQTHLMKITDDFQSVVSSAAVLLRRLADHRRALCRRPQREALWHLGRQMTHSMHLLAHCTATAATTQTNTEAKVGLGLACGRVEQLLDDLTSQLEPDADLPDLEEPGAFTKQVDQVFEELDGCGRKDAATSVGQRVKVLLEGVLRHSLAVAHCGGGGGGSEAPTPHIMALADKVLRQLKVVITLERTITTTTTSNSSGGEYSEVDVRVAVEGLADSVEQLEQTVNTSLITLIAQTFADPLAPLDTLMAAATQEGGGVKEVEDAVSIFDTHTDAIFQAAGFATACTSNRRCVREIRAHLATLEWLEGVLVPALMTHAHTPHTHMHTLAAHWTRTVLGLRECLDEMLDPTAFVVVTRREVQRLWGEVKDHLYTQNLPWLQQKVHRIMTLISHILHLSPSSSSSSSSSSIQPSWLPHHTAQDLRSALREVQGGLARVTTSPTTLSLHRSLLKRLQLSLTVLARLSTTLEAGSLHQTSAPRHRTLQHSDSGGGAGGGSSGWKLSEEEKHHLITTNIEDIPVDITTPTTTTTVTTTPAQPVHKAPTPSPARLGEGRGRGAGTSVVVPGPSSDTLPCDTTLDITRFLSRSSTVLSSTRGSRRNFSLKVREINLDIEAALEVGRGGGAGLTPLPPSPLHPHHTETGGEEGQQVTGDDEVRMKEVSGADTGLGEVSALINQEMTQLSQAPHSVVTPEDELSAVLESLTSLVGDLSGLPVSPPPRDSPQEAIKGRAIQGNPPTTTGKSGEVLQGGAEQTNTSTAPKKPWVTFLGTAGQENMPLRGITLQNASFSPHFPEIRPGEEEGEEEVFPAQEEMEGRREVEEEGRGVGGLLEEVWKDFTAILEARTPGSGTFREAEEGCRGFRDKMGLVCWPLGEKTPGSKGENKSESGEKEERVRGVKSKKKKGRGENRMLNEGSEAERDKKKRKSRGNKENDVLNFTNNFTTLNHHSSSSSSSSSSLSKQSDLSDTPFLTPPSSSLKLPFFSSTSFSSSSSPPSSCNITTSQRLQDLQTVQYRLQAVRGCLDEEV